MRQSKELQFEKPSFRKRLKGMLGVDFYRLFHTPMFYIFVAIAAIIPAMILTMMSSGDSGTQMYTNTWQIIAAQQPLYAVTNMGEYANMNMVYIFGGIMVSIFIGHDYRSGYVKQLFTTHAKKRDYMMSKTIVCAFTMACMCLSYLVGSIIAGFIAGTPFSVNVGSLLIAILSKIILSLGWASLYTFLNVILRRYFGVAIAASFAIGTGLPILAVGMILGNSAGSFLNLFLYGASVYACLSSTFMTLLVCLAVSVAWALIYNILGSLILARSDVY
ncbi:MAG: ABC transporter permease [Clostridiales bacterium]|nr:ABC transporter permease [Clostridiales bacterium]